MLGPEWAGRTQTYGLAFYDRSSGTFSPVVPKSLAISLRRGVLTVDSQNRLVAAGSSGPSDRVVRWNGAAWEELPGLDASGISSLKVTPGGDLVAVGEFVLDGGKRAFIMQWAQGQWAPVAPGLNGKVRCIAFAPNGDWIVAGSFTNSGTLFTPGVARWNGTAWSELGEVYGTINTVLAGTDGTIVIGGDFTTIGMETVNHVARWDGQKWVAMGSGLSKITVRALAELAGGGIVASGDLYQPGVFDTPRGIARWDGASWQSMNGGVRSADLDLSVSSLLSLPDGTLLAAGNFKTLGDDARAGSSLAAWSLAAGWSETARGMDGLVYAIARTPDGDFVVGGAFYGAGDATTSRNIARWDGSRFSPLGSGVSSVVRHIEILPDASLVVLGSAVRPDGTVISGALRWDGTSWNLMPGGGMVEGFLAQRAHGQLLSSYRINTPTEFARGLASWDGDQWVRLTSDQVAGPAIETRDGAIVSAGVFPGAATQRIARLERGVWNVLGSTPWLSSTNLNGLVESPIGHLVAYGGFGIREWDGFNWLVVASPGAVRALRFASNGDVIAALSTNGVSILRAGTTTWQSTAVHGATWDVEIGPRGELVVAGDFVTVADKVSRTLAISRCECSADQNADGFLTFEDFDAFAIALESGDAAADFNGDGFLTFEDFDALVAEFEAGC